MPLPSWLTRVLAPAPAAAPGERSDAHPEVVERTVRGIPALVVNTRPDVDTGDALARLDAALGLVADHTPHRFRHLRRDVRRLVVRRYPCRGAYDPATGDCLVELTFVVNRSFNPAQVAATIVHEGAHARLHRLGFPLDMRDRERQERFCRRAEIEFGRAAPGGEPVVARALAILEAEGVDVAPVIDAAVAAARVAAVDRAERRARR
jgi:HEXXH motif-containing protein